MMTTSENIRKVAIVTGGGRGIGKELAITLAENGWDVAISYLGSEEGAIDTVSRIEQVGGKALSARCDVGVKDEVDAFVANVTDAFARVPDLLINNAGIQTWSPLLDLKEEDWSRVIRTNLTGCFLNTQSVARKMVDAGKGGVIINIGSGCNKHPFPNLVDYTASKGGIEMFTKVAALELAQYKIRVNCLAPGAIEIERTAIEAPGYAETWAKITPLGRVGCPADIAAAVLFLAGEAAEFITGQTLWVDGGVFTQTVWPYQT